MTRTFLAAIAIAASAGLAAPLAAQSSMQKKYHSKETTITGCLEQTSRGFRLTNVESLPSAPMPNGTSGMTGSEANVNQTFDLKTGMNLNRHVGHKVQVTGYPETGTRNQVKGTAGTTGQTQNFAVRSLKMISSICHSHA
jgi:hypothetical protein